MQVVIKFANACEFDHRKAFHIPHFDFFEESASVNPMLFNGSAFADRGQVSDKSNSATSLTQGLSAPLKLSKTCLLSRNDNSRWLTLRVTTRTIHNPLGKVLKKTQGDKGISSRLSGNRFGEIAILVSHTTVLWYTVIEKLEQAANARAKRFMRITKPEVMVNIAIWIAVAVASAIILSFCYEFFTK